MKTQMIFVVLVLVGTFYGIGLQGTAVASEIEADSVSQFVEEAEPKLESKKLEALKNWNQLSDAEKEAFRKQHPRMGRWSKQKRENFVRRWDALSPKERQALRKKHRLKKRN
jgi:hypothetical protein